MKETIEEIAEKYLAKYAKNYKKTVEDNEKPLYFLQVNGSEAIRTISECYRDLVEPLREALTILNDAIEYMEKECSASYVITIHDKELIKAALSSLPVDAK